MEATVIKTQKPKTLRHLRQCLTGYRGWTAAAALFGGLEVVLEVLRMVPADSRRIPRAPRYSGYYYASTTYEYATVMLYGLSFQKVLLRCLHATT